MLPSTCEHAFSQDVLGGLTARMRFDEAACSLAMMPDFLEKTGYRNPSDTTDGPLQFALQTDLGLFAFINEQPKRLGAFNTFMEGQRAGKVS